jgi:hypothetical protein
MKEIIIDMEESGGDRIFVMFSDSNRETRTKKTSSRRNQNKFKKRNN